MTRSIIILHPSTKPDLLATIAAMGVNLLLVGEVGRLDDGRIVRSIDYIAQSVFLPSGRARKTAQWKRERMGRRS